MCLESVTGLLSSELNKFKSTSLQQRSMIREILIDLFKLLLLDL